MFPETVFVTGSNRGIGLGLVKYFVELEQPPQIIFAACRKPAQAEQLQNVAIHSQKAKVHVVELDILNEQSILDAQRFAARELQGKGLDLLINNAGINSQNQTNPFCAQSLTDHFRVNCAAQVAMAKAFVPLLEAGATSGRPSIVCMISSQRASLAQRFDSRRPAYAISKTALNMASKLLSVELKEANIIVVPVHPGHVKTDIGGPDAPLTPRDSAEAILKLLRTLELRDSGTYFNYDGSILPW